MKTNQEFANDFKNQLAMLTKEELVIKFNREIGNNGWVSVRAIYLGELRKAMVNAGIDISLILNDSGGFNLNKSVQLINDRIEIMP